MNIILKSILACLLMFYCATVNAQSKRDQIENLNHIVDSLKSSIQVLISESVDQQLSLGSEIKYLKSQMEDCERQQKQKQTKLDASVKSVDELTEENASMKLKLTTLQDSLRNCRIAILEVEKNYSTLVALVDSNRTPNEQNNGSHEKKQNPTDFLPKGYVVFEKKNGDLNNDGVDDCVLIIKGTESNQIINDEYLGQLDRNRRGVIVLFNKKQYYELALQNYDCFSSENEDGGAYYAPELSIEIERGNLSVQYLHGRYGGWTYTFRFQNSDFELIGYDRSESDGPVVNSITSVNFLTKSKLVKVNTNENDSGGEEVLKVVSEKIVFDQLIKLSDIDDFDELDMSSY